MSGQQAAILTAADRVKVAQAESKDVVIQLPAVTLRDKIEHHFSAWTISQKATRDVDFAIDALP